MMVKIKPILFIVVLEMKKVSHSLYFLFYVSFFVILFDVDGEYKEKRSFILR